MADEWEYSPFGELEPTLTSERLTELFYAWERRGRGWQVSSSPVALEPAYHAFRYHYDPSSYVPIDDGRTPSLFEKLFKPRSKSPPQEADEPSDEDLVEEEPEGLSDLPLVCTRVAFPEGQKVSREAAEQFLLSLSACAYPVCSEIVGSHDAICLQVACREPDLSLVRHELRAHFPEAVLSPDAVRIDDRWSDPRIEYSVVDFGLSQEFMRPLVCTKNFDPDPLIGLFGALALLEEKDGALLQVLFQPARNAWGESIIRAVTDWRGRSFFVDSPEMLTLAKEKTSCPLFAVVLRVAAWSAIPGRAWDIVKSVGGTLAQFGSPESNELVPLTNDEYPADVHREDVLERRSHRCGMILNSAEFASIAHFPSASVKTTKLERVVRKTKEVTTVATGRRLLLGENHHAGATTPVTLDTTQRLQHIHVIGATGTGKSTLLLNLAIQDVQHGEGFGVLDPHGDFIETLLGYIPEERASDVVLLDPSDEEYPIGLNILSAHSATEANLLASDLASVFRRLSTSWGDQMTSVLSNAVLAFLESEAGGTLADLRRFLVEREYRDAFLETVRDEEVVYFWRKEFPLLAGRPSAPLLTRLDIFLRPKPIRRMVSQLENRLDFAKIMDERKIFLAKLSQGTIGEENAYLLGSLVVSKFHQLAMSRQELAQAERRPFFLYVDEFQHFITPSMAAVLSGARKYHLGLVLAHQDLDQLSRGSTDLLNTVLSNPYTRIAFRVGQTDAKRLSEGLSFFGADDLQNLGVGEAICRIERADFDCNLTTSPPPRIDAEAAKRQRERAIERSRTQYGVKEEERREQVSPMSVLPKPRRERPPKEAPPEPSVPARPVRTTPEHAPPEIFPVPVTMHISEVPSATPSVGRGGRQHQYLQQLVKRWADARGYHVTIEDQVLGGLGAVDVALRRNGVSVACEISVTTGAEHELENLQKCLSAGFDYVALIATERKALRKIEELVSAELTDAERERVQFVTPDELFSFLEGLEAEAAGDEKTVKGYKVKTRLHPLGDGELSIRRQAVTKVIAQALRRLGGNGKETKG